MLRLLEPRMKQTHNSESGSRFLNPLIPAHRVGHRHGKGRHRRPALHRRKCHRSNCLRLNFPKPSFRSCLKEPPRRRGNQSLMDRERYHQPFPAKSSRRLLPFPARPPQPPHHGLSSRAMAKPSLVNRYNHSIRTTTPTHRLEFRAFNRSFRRREPTCQPGQAAPKVRKVRKRLHWVRAPTRLRTYHQSDKGQVTYHRRLKVLTGNPSRSPPSFRKVSIGVRDWARSDFFRTLVPSTLTCMVKTATNCKCTNWNCSPV